MAFVHPHGVAFLLQAVGAVRARFPAEVYNLDEDALPLSEDDAALSEFARGLRYARRQAASLPLPDAELYATRLAHAAQVRDHLALASLARDPLTVDDLLLREQYRDTFGIGRGEAACLVLARRYGATALFVSSDATACQISGDLGVAHITLPQVLAAWVDTTRPTLAELDALIAGMRAARFGLSQAMIADLQTRTQS